MACSKHNFFKQILHEIYCIVWSTKVIIQFLENNQAEKETTIFYYCLQIEKKPEWP